MDQNMKLFVMVMDGVRPDSLPLCKNNFFEDLKTKSTWTMGGQSIDPPITLPAHTTMFTGVLPEAHHITNNKLQPYPAQFLSLFDLVHKNGMKTAEIVAWEPLTHLSREESIDKLVFTDSTKLRQESADKLISMQKELAETAAVLSSSKEYKLIFFHYQLADAMGHAFGWMSSQYLSSVAFAGTCAKIIMDKLDKDTQFILLADHGGHDKDHFDPNNPEDMKIPAFFCGSLFPKGKELKDFNLTDLAPTACAILGLDKQPCHTGRNILEAL